MAELQRRPSTIGTSSAKSRTEDTCATSARTLVCHTERSRIRGRKSSYGFYRARSASKEVPRSSPRKTKDRGPSCSTDIVMTDARRSPSGPKPLEKEPQPKHTSNAVDKTSSALLKPPSNPSQKTTANDSRRKKHGRRRSTPRQRRRDGRSPPNSRAIHNISAIMQGT